MTNTSVLFFLFGALVLWGGLAVTLVIAIRQSSKKKNNE